MKATTCSVFATMFRCVSTAPLETPVVPPVYCRKATSSPVTSTGSSSSEAPFASASLKRTEPGSDQAGTILRTLRITKFVIAAFGKPSRSPMPVTTTFATFVRAMTCSSVAAAFSKMTTTVAPESLSWCSSSRAVYSGLTLTTMQPARCAPTIAMGYCRRFGIMIATRSPGPRPAAFCSQAPKRRDCSSTSA